MLCSKSGSEGDVSEFPSERWFRRGIHNLRRRAYARWSAGNPYQSFTISRKIIDVTEYRSRVEYSMPENSQERCRRVLRLELKIAFFNILTAQIIFFSSAPIHSEPHVLKVYYNCTLKSPDVCVCIYCSVKHYRL